MWAKDSSAPDPELKSTFAKDKGLCAGRRDSRTGCDARARCRPSVIDDARAALLSMGFSPQETDVALSGYDGQGVSRICSARRLSDLGNGCVMWEADDSQDLWATPGNCRRHPWRTASAWWARS